jgi:hypothetical protein
MIIRFTLQLSPPDIHSNWLRVYSDYKRLLTHTFALDECSIYPAPPYLLPRNVDAFHVRVEKANNNNQGSSLAPSNPALQFHGSFKILIHKLVRSLVLPTQSASPSPTYLHLSSSTRNHTIHSTHVYTLENVACPCLYSTPKLRALIRRLVRHEPLTAPLLFLPQFI